MNNLVLVAATVAVNDLIIALIFIAYSGNRLYDINRQCAERIEQANAEVMAMRSMVKKTEMQARVLGSTPVSRLIGDDEI